MTEREPATPEGNIVTCPASLWTAPFEGWQALGWTDGGVEFTPINMASRIAAVTASFERLHGAVVTTEATFSQGLLDLLMGSDPNAEIDETTGPDTFPCAGSGGRWSDLMAQIDDLVDGEQA